VEYSLRLASEHRTCSEASLILYCTNVTVC